MKSYEGKVTFFINGEEIVSASTEHKTTSRKGIYNPSKTTRKQKIQWLMDNYSKWSHLHIDEIEDPYGSEDLYEIAKLMKHEGLYSDSYSPCNWAISKMMIECRAEICSRVFSEIEWTS